MYLKSEYSSFSWCSIFVEHSSVNFDFVPHQHNFAEAVIILSGSADHLVADRRYPLKPGDTFVIKEGVAHGFQNVHDLQLINLMYDAKLLLQESYNLRTIPGFFPLFIAEPELRLLSDYPFMLSLGPKDRSYVTMMADFIADQLSEDNANHEPCIRASFLALLSFLAVRYEAHVSQSPHAQCLAKAIHFIQLNADKPIRVADIAASAYLSSRQLERLFRQYHQCSPNEYLIRHRLWCAFSLLLQGDESIGSVAARCGFSDASYFSRAFKQYYGIRPNDVGRFICTDHGAVLQP